MKEKLNLVEILKNCSKGTKLWSDVYGEVSFYEIDVKSDPFPIIFVAKYNDKHSVTCDGRLNVGYDGKCILWPSEDCRDWSNFKSQKPKFDPKTLKPFDKVLVFCTYNNTWGVDLFSHFDSVIEKYICVGAGVDKIIPYNDNTKHLVGTTKKAPEFYRYWED